MRTRDTDSFPRWFLPPQRRCPGERGILNPVSANARRTSRRPSGSQHRASAPPRRVPVTCSNLTQVGAAAVNRCLHLPLCGVMKRPSTDLPSHAGTLQCGLSENLSKPCSGDSSASCGHHRAADRRTADRGAVPPPGAGTPRLHGERQHLLGVRSLRLADVDMGLRQVRGRGQGQRDLCDAQRRLRSPWARSDLAVAYFPWKNL
jgi:hypothetical protein